MTITGQLNRALRQAGGISFLIICVALVYGMNFFGVLVAEPGQQKPQKMRLPNIWGLPGPANTKMTGSFRILSEIRLLGQKSGSQSYFAEEWSDGNLMLYRLDLSSVEDPANQLIGPRTIIVDGVKNERYYYEPYKCVPFDKLGGGAGSQSVAPISSVLSEKFPQDHEFIIGGLGSIWMHASNKRFTFKQASTSGGSSSTIPSKAGKTLDPKRCSLISFRNALNGYDQFIVDASDEFRYTTKFLFQFNGLRREDGTIDANSLVAIQLIEPFTHEIVLSAKIIEIDTCIEALVKINSRRDLFALPVGYGCVRRQCGHPEPLAEIEPPKYRPPMPCFAHSDTNDARPRVCNIQAETVSSQNAQIHTSSLRLASGIIHNRPYVTVERRHFVEAHQRKLGESSLQRIRQIWDLGDTMSATSASGTANAASAAAKRDKTAADDKAIYFELNSNAAKCNEYRVANLDEVATIELPILMPTGSGSSASSQSYTTQVLGLSLDPDTLHQLFVSAEGYHMIRQNMAVYLKYRDYTQERRIDEFKLVDKRGRVAWTGPVSAVRKFVLYEKKSDSDDDDDDGDEIDHEKGNGSKEHRLHFTKLLDVDVDIYFYSQSLDKLLALVHLRLTPGQHIDQAYLHRELDIAPCLHKYGQHSVMIGSLDPDATEPDQIHAYDHSILYNGNDKNLPSLPPASHLSAKTEGLRFYVIYGLDLDDDSEDGQLVSQLGQQIYMKFLDKLLNLHSQGNWLNVLQVSDIQVDIEADSMIKVSAVLDKWPEVFNFNKRRGLKFIKSLKPYELANEIKASEAACAESCSHFNCPMLAYCSDTKICHISTYDWLDQSDYYASRLLEPIPDQVATGKSAVGGISDKRYMFEVDANCNVLLRRTWSRNNPRGYASPREALNNMQRLIAIETEDDEQSTELAIELDLLDSLSTSTSEAQMGKDSDAPRRTILLVPSSISVENEQNLMRDEMLAVTNGGSSGSASGTGDLLLDESRAEQFSVEYRIVEQDKKLVRTYKGEPTLETAEVHHVSYLDCELMCTKADCNSFSYCPMDTICLIKHHDSSGLYAYSIVPEPHCFILERLHLGRFIKGSQTIVTLEQLVKEESPGGRGGGGGPGDGEQLVESHTMGAQTNEACATLCLELAYFTCRSFLFCPSLTHQAKDCTMFSDWRAGGDGQQNNYDNGDDIDKRIETAKSMDPFSPTKPHKCDTYQRSYLIDYNTIRAKQLMPTTEMPPSITSSAKSNGLMIKLLLDLDADACAMECSSQWDGVLCPAFHVCVSSYDQDDIGRGSRQSLLTCALLVAGHGEGSSATNFDELERGLTGGELLKDSSSCTTFVAKKSSANKSDDDEHLDEHGRAESTEQTEPTPSSINPSVKSSTSWSWNWISASLVVLFGLTVGYVLTWLLSMQNYHVSTQIMSLRYGQARISQMTNDEVS